MSDEVFQKMLRKLVLSMPIAFGLYLATFSFNGVLADEKITLRLTANHLPPYLNINNEPDKIRYSGFEVDLSTEISARTNLQFEYVECIWHGCMEALKEGKIDIVHSVVLTEERLEFMEFLSPNYLEQEYATLFYQSIFDDRIVSSLEDMVQQKLIVGYLGSTFYFPEFDNSNALLKVEVSNLDVGIKQLLSGRIDLLAGYNELFLGLDKAELAALRDLKAIAYRPIVKQPSYTAMSRKSDKLHVKPELQEALQSIIADGTMSRLKNKWIVSLK